MAKRRPGAAVATYTARAGQSHHVNPTRVALRPALSHFHMTLAEAVEEYTPMARSRGPGWGQGPLYQMAVYVWY